jgi:hypothetical protein
MFLHALINGFAVPEEHELALSKTFVLNILFAL